MSLARGRSPCPEILLGGPGDPDTLQRAGRTVVSPRAEARMPDASGLISRRSPRARDRPPRLRPARPTPGVAADRSLHSEPRSAVLQVALNIIRTHVVAPPAQMEFLPLSALGGPPSSRRGIQVAHHALSAVVNLVPKLLESQAEIHVLKPVAIELVEAARLLEGPALHQRAGGRHRMQPSRAQNRRVVPRKSRV